jgi:hypothetical protein
VSKPPSGVRDVITATQGPAARALYGGQPLLTQKIWSVRGSPFLEKLRYLCASVLGKVYCVSQRWHTINNHGAFLTVTERIVCIKNQKMGVCLCQLICNICDHVVGFLSRSEIDLTALFGVVKRS